MNLGRIAKEAVLHKISLADAYFLRMEGETCGLKELISSGILKESEVDSAIENSVISSGVRDYDRLIKHGLEYFEHEMHSEYLVLAVEKGVFQRKTLKISNR